MSQESNDKRRGFEQKMRDQGADGFADGPRPWETWDESGNQANSRVWEGSARRVNGKHSLGYRILSVLAFMALATLLVGIGGVYYTHTQTQQIADAGTQPLPVINRRAPIIAPAEKNVIVAATETENLNTLTAPAAGSAATSAEKEEAVAETAVMESEPPPPADEAATETTIDVTPAIASETVPPTTIGNIDSVAIETVVTEQSITTTVYTRHPQQDEPEIVSTIETTPPPFAHEVAAAEVTTEQEVTVLPATGQTDTLVLSGVETLDTPGEQIGDTTTVTAAEDSSAEITTETVVETAPETTEDQADTIAEEQPVEPAEDVTTVALAEESNETAVVESPAETVPESEPEPVEVQQAEIVEPVFPVEKTGGWVINLSSYTWKSTANRKLALFQQQGVDAEVFEVVIKDKPMYRIRVTGFKNSRAAKAEIPMIEEKLDLEGAWISKR
jgi:hypothetical protein